MIHDSTKNINDNSIINNVNNSKSKEIMSIMSISLIIVNNINIS